MTAPLFRVDDLHVQPEKSDPGPIVRGIDLALGVSVITQHLLDEFRASV